MATLYKAVNNDLVLMTDEEESSILSERTVAAAQPLKTYADTVMDGIIGDPRLMAIITWIASLPQVNITKAQAIAAIRARIN